jgi:hypothetical protein
VDRVAIGWSGAVLAALASLWAPPSAVAQQSRAVAEEDKPENYPAGPHRDDTFYFCTACHSFRIVAQQGMTTEQWHETLDWMEEKHGLPKTEGKERDDLVDYLATAFPQKQRPGWRNPFLK